MKQSIICSIESVCYKLEKAYQISIDWNNLENAIVLFSAFNLDVIKQITLISEDGWSLMLLKKNTHNKCLSVGIQIDGKAYSLPPYWLDTILCMLIKSKIYGWSQTDHVDQDLSSGNESISLCFCVSSGLV